MTVTADIAEEFDGKLVRVYLCSGVSLKGRATFKEDGWIVVVDEENGGRTAACNLSHVISVSLL